MANLDRLRIPSKVFTASFTHTADGLITFSNIDGQNTPYLPIDDIDWERIVVDLDITAASGTSPTLDVKAKTVNKPGGTAIVNGTLDLKDGGGTSFAMTQATAATREVKACGRRNADADGAGVSNAGKYLAFWGEIGGTGPSFTGTLTVYVGL